MEVIPLFSPGDEKETVGIFSEKSFEELFADYYAEKKGVFPEPEVLELLREIVQKEGEDASDLDETQGIE